MLGDPLRRHSMAVKRKTITNVNQWHASSTHDHFPTSSKKKRSMPLTWVLFSGLLVCGFIVASRSSNQQVAIAAGGHEKRATTTEISPFTSIPPEPVALTNVPRHTCLRNMRSRHENTIRQYLAEADHILLVDPAYHSNVGDHMITLGELKFLQSFISEREIEISQCSYIQAGSYVPPCESEIPRLARTFSHPVAIWHGGGNWGDLWRRAQEPRVASFALLASNGYTVVTMPNSWFYKDRTLELKDVETIKTSVESVWKTRSQKDGKQRLVFCWREVYSYERGEELLTFATNFLLPDIAFQLGPYNPIRSNMNQNVDILLLLRDDHESVLTQKSRADVRSLLSNLPNGQSVSFSIVDWNDRLTRFDSKDIFFTPSAIQLLSLGRIVVCDRLHAAILSYLMGIPFLYIDQVSGKITKTLNASLSECPNDKQLQFERASSIEVALSKAMHWLSKLEPEQMTSREAIRERLRRKKQGYEA